LKVESSEFFNCSLLIVNCQLSIDNVSLQG